MQPEVVVPLGATAAQALLGPPFKVTRHRGEVLDDTGIAPHVVPTVHPSSVLRGEPDDRARDVQAMVDDLEVVAHLI